MALRVEVGVHREDGGRGFLEREQDRPIARPLAAQHHEGLGRPAVARNGQADGVEQLHPVGRQFERQHHGQRVARIAQHDAGNVQGLRRVAHGRHVHILHQLGAVAGDERGSLERRQGGLLVVLRGVPDGGRDHVEHLVARLVRGDLHRALVFCAIGAARDHGQVGVGERAHAGGVAARAQIELARRIGPLPCHGLRQIVQRVPRGCAEGQHDGCRVKRARRLGHAVHGVDGGGVADVGRGRNPRVLRRRDGCALAELRVRNDVAGQQCRVFAPRGGGGARVIHLGAADHRSYIGQSRWECRLVVSEFANQVSHTASTMRTCPQVREHRN